MGFRRGKEQEEEEKERQEMDGRMLYRVGVQATEKKTEYNE